MKMVGFYQNLQHHIFLKLLFFLFLLKVLILNEFTFLLSKSSSDIAQSILSPPVNLDGLASAAFIAI